ncbi:unnamed protein product [Fusarium venenatum]|uniref:Uncharacterized protein n=1 Tax=Fusarium venenatum TaxID=56646 RepID=A0A2L2TSH1_9HYPO|nr:uncharacterized protein FVRRES_03278 [Fusarium venenatum]CEI66766.1 unnamed protein product [Fusarium venenatum]
MTQAHRWGRSAWLIGLRIGLVGFWRTLGGASLTSPEQRTETNNELSLDSAGDSGGGRKLLACITTVNNASFSDGNRIGVMDVVLDGGYSLIQWVLNPVSLRIARLMASVLH